MAVEKTSEVSQPGVRAVYGSPDDSNTFTQSITSPHPTDTKSKAAYINSLRSATKTLQKDINTFLTAKMDQDKQVAAGSTTNGSKNKSRDEEEEENYGEEKVEDDQDTM